MVNRSGTKEVADHIIVDLEDSTGQACRVYRWRVTSLLGMASGFFAETRYHVPEVSQIPITPNVPKPFSWTGLTKAHKVKTED